MNVADDGNYVTVRLIQVKADLFPPQGSHDCRNVLGLSGGYFARKPAVYRALIDAENGYKIFLPHAQLPLERVEKSRPIRSRPFGHGPQMRLRITAFKCVHE